MVRLIIIIFTVAVELNDSLTQCNDSVVSVGIGLFIVIIVMVTMIYSSHKAVHDSSV